MIKITVPARIHITLFELGADGYRRNGGIGFSVNHSSVELTFVTNGSTSLELLRTIGFDDGEIDALTRKIDSAKSSFSFEHSIQLIHAKSIGRHVGFGSGTGVALAHVEALGILNKAHLSQSTITQLSGRGGTSGIGISTYFSGGFIFDAGREFDNVEAKSSDDVSTVEKAPLVVMRHDMPSWPIGIFTAEDLEPISIEKERHLFASKLPLTMSQVESTTYHGVMGALVSVVDQNYSAFCRAINNIQRCEWKQQEIALSGSILSRHMTVLRGLGCDAVGVSSLGPTLYFLSNDMPSTLANIKAAFPNAQVDCVLPNNWGRSINYV